MTSDEFVNTRLKTLIEDLRINHEYNEKEVFLQAADELERLQKGIETLYTMYEQVCKQRDQLMDVQRSMVEALRGRIQ
jgi:archaellum component FlaC